MTLCDTPLLSDEHSITDRRVQFKSLSQHTPRPPGSPQTPQALREGVLGMCRHRHSRVSGYSPADAADMKSSWSALPAPTSPHTHARRQTHAVSWEHLISCVSEWIMCTSSKSFVLGYLPCCVSQLELPEQGAQPGALHSRQVLSVSQAGGWRLEI